MIYYFVVKNYIKFYISILIFISFNFSVLAYANEFIKTFLVYYVNPIKFSDIAKLAKYDVLVLNRFNYDDINGHTWKIIKQNNPSCKIFIYQLGPETSDKQDYFNTIYLNSISRYKIPRGHSMGIIPEKFFLKDKNGHHINNPHYPNCWLLDFGNISFQRYWAEATKNDILQMSWKADGIMIDNCTCAAKKFPNNPFGGPMPTKYPDAHTWNSAMNNFVIFITDFLHKNNNEVFTNRGNSRDNAGYEAWLELDASTHPPDFIMEEGAFAVSWGDGDVQFYNEKEWKRQIDLGQQIKNSHIAYLSHTDLSEGKTGYDNFGKNVNFWQVLWYSLCSYNLAKNEKNMPYFMFTNNRYKKIRWYEEYDKINIGHTKGNYKILKTTSGNIYWREFENGYIYVNPTLKDVINIDLPVPCVKLTHTNLNIDHANLAIITKINIASHHGVILLKALSISPSSKISPPQNIRFAK